jgi:glycosyltransferase involved in cell wall biosynthesis
MTAGDTTRDHAFVVPAFGESRHLSDCLASIGAQSRRSDVLITTSTPSDALDAIARAHRVRVVVNPIRAGIGSDWNFALTASDARFVTLAHQDDAYDACYAARVLDALVRAKDALIAFCDFGEITASGPRPLHSNLRIKRMLCNRAFRGSDAIRTRRDKERLLAWGNPIGCNAVMFDRVRLPDFCFASEFASNLDWDAWLRLAAIDGAFVRVAEPLAYRRIHEDSETSALIADRRRVVEDLALFRRLWPAPIASLIAFAYRTSYRGNRV